MFFFSQYLLVMYFNVHLQVEKLGKDSLVNCAKTSMSSKLIGPDSDFFATLVRQTQSLYLNSYSIFCNMQRGSVILFYRA